MLTIRNEQKEVLSRIPLLDFERSLVRFVREFYRREYQELGRETVYSVVRDCISRARERGYGSKRQSTYYLGLMMLLGSRFDEDFQIPWAGRMLDDQEVSPPTERIARLWGKTVEYLGQTAGEHNEHLALALIRTRKLAREDCPSSSGRVLEQDLYDFLGRIYPEKFQYQGESINRRLISESVSLASEFGLNDAVGIATVLLHMFFLGSFFHTDILYGWAGEILRAPGFSSPREKVEKLRQTFIGRLEPALRDK